MNNYDLVLYIGIAFYVLIFFLFIKNEMNKTRLDREKFNSDKLTKSYNDNKLSGGHIKKWITLMI